MPRVPARHGSRDHKVAEAVTAVQFLAALGLQRTSIEIYNATIPLEVTSLPFWMITNRCQ